MKRIIVLLAAVFLLFVAGCGSNDDDNVDANTNSTTDTTNATDTTDTVNSSSNDITAFSIGDNEGVIDQTEGTIIVPMHYTDLSALVATFTTTGASVTVGAATQESGTTANDYNNAVTYTVTAEDGSTRNYTATVFELDKFLVFESEATNLDSNYTATGYAQIYLRNMKTGTVDLVSVASDGVSPSASSSYDCNTSQRPTISADARYVAFDSQADNLVGTTFAGYRNVFVRDLQEGTTTLVSLGYDGNMGDECSKEPQISADGSFVVYASSATNILEGVSGGRQIYSYDMATGTTTLISAGYDGNPGDDCSRRPVVSADGKYVAFESMASNILDVGADGSYYQVYIKNLETGVTTLVSVKSDGVSPIDDAYCKGAMNPSISGDGRYVVFESDGEDLVDTTYDDGTRQIYVRDMQEGTTTLVSLGYDGNMGNCVSMRPVISADGSYVIYTSNASNLLEGVESDDRQVYRYDMATGTTTLVSVGYDGSEGDNCARMTSVSADGTYVYFESRATNLIDGGYTDDYSQVYMRDMAAGTTSMVSINAAGGAGDDDSYLVILDY